MRARICILAATLPLLVVSLAPAAEFIWNTKHNFKDYAWSSNQICKPCHTPHNAVQQKDAAGNLFSAKLWNHTLNTDGQAYNLHGGSSTYDANGNSIPATGVAGTSLDMDRVTRLCLSCHDGMVALDAFGGASGTAGLTMGSVASGTPMTANLGTDLSNDHPVGLKADIDTTGTRYRTIGLVKVGDMDNTQTPPKAAKSPFMLAYDPSTQALKTTNEKLGLVGLPTAGHYAVSCVTCHNQHGAGPTGSTTPYPKMLRTDNTNSALCLSCHMK